MPNAAKTDHAQACFTRRVPESSGVNSSISNRSSGPDIFGTRVSKLQGNQHAIRQSSAFRPAPYAIPSGVSKNIQDREASTSLIQDNSPKSEAAKPLFKSGHSGHNIVNTLPNYKMVEIWLPLDINLNCAVKDVLNRHSGTNTLEQDLLVFFMAALKDFWNKSPLNPQLLTESFRGIPKLHDGISDSADCFIEKIRSSSIRLDQLINICKQNQSLSEVFLEIADLQKKNETYASLYHVKISDFYKTLGAGNQYKFHDLLLDLALLPSGDGIAEMMVSDIGEGNSNDNTLMSVFIQASPASKGITIGQFVDIMGKHISTREEIKAIRIFLDGLTKLYKATKADWNSG